MKEQANNGCRYIGIDLGTSAMKLLLLMLKTKPSLIMTMHHCKDF